MCTLRIITSKKTKLYSDNKVLNQYIGEAIYKNSFMKRMLMEIDLFIEEKDWLIEHTQEQWLGCFEPLFDKAISFSRSPINKQVNVTLTNNEFMQKTNRQFRDINKPTNVLSFPLYTKAELDVMQSQEKVLLGDILMSYSVIDDEASIFGKTLYDRVSHLFVHGVLHILGYDHMTESDRRCMEKLEIQILSSLNIENPYILGSNI